MKSRAKSVIKGVRWSPAEWRRVTAQARAQDTTPSELVRSIVTAHLDLQSDGFESVSAAEVRAVVEQLRIARSVNK